MRNETVEISVFDVTRAIGELKEIQRLRYRIYVKEMGLNLAGADHALQILPDILDVPAIHIEARVQSELIGGVRLNVNTVPPGLETPLQTGSLPQPFVYCSRLNVLDDFRGKGVLPKLVAACFQKFEERHAAVAICHCYPHLFKLYERMGFQRYGTKFVTPGLEKLGDQTPFQRWLT